jgi:hypothetical protein
MLRERHSADGGFESAAVGWSQCLNWVKKRNRGQMEGMSASTPNADLGRALQHVVFVPNDLSRRSFDCLTTHRADVARRPLGATGRKSPFLAPRTKRLHPSRYRPAALFGGVTQGRFEGCVAMAPHLRHTLIATLGKEGRWLIIFKYASALLVLEENHAQRCVESSGS